ncbi:unnamed protein product [Trichobilharzia regenti]|nr:unnamed protein product [Trichobilharzia regenti]
MMNGIQILLMKIPTMMMTVMKNGTTKKKKKMERRKKTMMPRWILLMNLVVGDESANVQLRISQQEKDIVPVVEIMLPLKRNDLVIEI